MHAAHVFDELKGFLQSSVLDMPQTGTTLHRFIANPTSFCPVEDRVRPQVVDQPKWEHQQNKP